jgi:hypothetical protein
MTTIQHEIQAACPPASVWTLLADLEAVERYNPGVKRAAVVGTQRSGIGARRSCELSPKGRVIERVTHWEDGKAVGLEVVESDWPIHFMRWVTHIQPNEGGTRITQSLEYAVKFGPLGWLLDHLVMKRKLTSALDAVFSSMAKQAEESAAHRSSGPEMGTSNRTK